jgi:hypothetical protein
MPDRPSSRVEHKDRKRAVMLSIQRHYARQKIDYQQRKAHHGYKRTQFHLPLPSECQSMVWSICTPIATPVAIMSNSTSRRLRRGSGGTTRPCMTGWSRNCAARSAGRRISGLCSKCRHGHPPSPTAWGSHRRTDSPTSEVKIRRRKRCGTLIGQQNGRPGRSVAYEGVSSLLRDA